MTFKHKGKDNLSVTSLGVAFAAVSTVMVLLNRALLYQSQAALGEYFTSMASFEFVQALLVLLIVGFITGSLLAMIYNAMLRTKVGKKY